MGFGHDVNESGSGIPTTPLASSTAPTYITMPAAELGYLPPDQSIE